MTRVTDDDNGVVSGFADPSPGDALPPPPAATSCGPAEAVEIVERTPTSRISDALREVMKQRLAVLQEKAEAFGPPPPAHLGAFLRSCSEGLRAAGIQEADEPVQQHFATSMGRIGWDLKRNCSVGASPPEFGRVVSWLEENAAETTGNLSITAFSSREKIPLTSLLEEYGKHDPNWQKVKVKTGKSPAKADKGER